jgi:hypothetical protein
MTKREQLMLATQNFKNALDVDAYTPSERERMIAGARLFIRAQSAAGLFGPAIADDARAFLLKTTKPETEDEEILLDKRLILVTIPQD